MSAPIVWSIAGSDSGGGAGLQADNHTLKSLGCHPCNVITAITAQNSVTVDACWPLPATQLIQQWQTLAADLPAAAIKLGMLGNLDNLRVLQQQIEQTRASEPSISIVCDPVLGASTGAKLAHDELIDGYRELLPQLSLITPNLSEAQQLTGLVVNTSADMESAAHQLCEMGCRAVLLTGGHLHDQGPGHEHWALDFYLDAEQQFWLATPRWPNDNNHGTGCTLASAIAAALAHGYQMPDAVVIGKATVSQAIRWGEPQGHGAGPVNSIGWPNDPEDLPLIVANPQQLQQRQAFASCGSQRLGLYPIVDNLEHLREQLDWGTETIQLRIKDCQEEQLEAMIVKAIAMAAETNARLFINDYWQLAIKHGAYGVHLGQEDIVDADLLAIRDAGLRLGLSTHCHHEVARAHAWQPSYIALGPIYHTQLKQMPFEPQGIGGLQYWVDWLQDYPLVAIAGINEERASDVMATGAGSFAVVSAISLADDRHRATQRLQALQ